MPTRKTDGMGRKKKTEDRTHVQLYVGDVLRIRALASAQKTDPSDWFREHYGEAIRRQHVKLLEEQLRQSKKP